MNFRLIDLEKWERKEYYNHYINRLDKIGVDKIFDELMKAKGDKENLVLMCYEKNADECHRRMFAEWWMWQTGEIIEEI